MYVCRSAITALATKLNQYCNQTDHHGDTEDEDRSVVLFLVGLLCLTGLTRLVSGGDDDTS